MGWKRYDVFLSYSRADAERIGPLLDGLRQSGYKLFFDLQSIEPGKPWKRRLERAISASRVLVLCWSESARGSDYITFEYSRAEALGRPVYPWLLDQTPLPAMLELQGISDPDGAHVAEKLLPYLGWPLQRRQFRFYAVALFFALLLGFSVWRALHPPPPPPWTFQGEVHDRQTRIGIAGVEVDIELNGQTLVTYTDAQGRYLRQLPLPMPPTVNIEYKKSGYMGDKTYNWISSRFDTMDLARLNDKERR